MKNKLFNYIVFILMFIYVTKTSAALPDNFSGVKQVGSNTWDKCSSVNEDGTPNCFAMPLKKAVINGSDVAVICSKYYSAVPAGQTCTKADWTDKLRYGVAAIINQSKTKINTTKISVEYFAAEMAINRLVHDNTSGAGGAKINDYSLSDNTGLYSYNETSNVFSSEPIVSSTTGLKTLFNNYYAAGTSAVSNFDPAVPISLSAQSLTFTLKDDYYVSNSITVTGGSGYELSNSNGMEITKNGNSFQVKVKKSDVTAEKTITISVSTHKSLELASNYSCGSNYQTLTPVLLESKKYTSDLVNISGTITPEPEKAKLTINKFDNKNQYLAGAKIKVTGPNNYDNEFTTNGASLILDNLEFGTYTVEEIETPKGYVTAPKQTVTLDKNNLDKTITLINNRTKVKISKVDATGKKELPGATLEIQDKDGNIVKYCTDDKGNTGVDCKWVSTDKPHEIEGMPVGTYYLVETMAPKGYVLNEEKVKFEITNTSAVKTVKMENKFTVVKISKVNAVDKKELPGATLEIQDKDGNIVKYCTDDKGNTGVDCKWVSTDKPYEIEGMPVGTYYLVEAIAPKGYVLNEEKVKFEITNTSTVVEVEIVNDLEVEVPNTLGERSALLLAIAMFDIFLGIGILTYVRKNKEDKI